jgi:dihydroceramide fatty acyl 2-hydroxylase
MKKAISSRQQLKCFGIFLLIVLPLLLTTIFLVKNPVLFFILNFLPGLLGWTYLEYHLHRFWTHNKSANATREAFKRHVHHHKHPTEIKVTTAQRTILLSVSILLFSLSIKWNNYFTVPVAFIIGFSYSFFSHWILHQGWSAKIFPRLHRFHIHHHCKYPDRCFGFSTIFWDLIFQTTPPKDAVITERIIQFYYGHHH